MDHKAAGENLKIISAILEEWNAAGSIGNLEYDILLDRIKSLYDEVKFRFNHESDVRVQVKTPCEAVKEVSDCEEREAAKGPSSSGHRETVRALYGDGRVPEPSVTNGGSEEGFGRDTNAASGTSSRQVLGEVIGSCGPTVADQLNVSTVDVASKLGYEKISSLRSCIGLNDKYMFVRDLFGGDTEAYEKAIEALDSFGSIEDAMIYIYDNFDWKASEPAADALCGMLAAKLI